MHSKNFQTLKAFFFFNGKNVTVYCVCVCLTRWFCVSQCVGMKLQNWNSNTAVFQFYSHSPPVQTF